MSCLLHLDSSHAASDHSITRSLTATYATTWLADHAGGSYVHRGLAADPVPTLGPAYATLGERVERRGVVAPTDIAAIAEGDDERAEWAATLPLIEELCAADVVLFGVPMYNFTVPATLKAWIDRVTFPGVFTDPATSDAVLGHLDTVVIMARGGGGYGMGGPREALDFQESYLRAYVTNYLRVPEENQSYVSVEFTRFADIPELAGYVDHAASSLAEAEQRVVELARRGRSRVSD